jgi:putative transcriptional regulator
MVMRIPTRRCNVYLTSMSCFHYILPHGEQALPSCSAAADGDADFGLCAGRREGLLRAHAVNNRLRTLRADRRWSQAELGLRVGVSRQAIIAIETGRFDPSLPLAFKLARVFGVTIEKIFHADGE